MRRHIVEPPGTTTNRFLVTGGIPLQSFFELPQLYMPQRHGVRLPLMRHLKFGIFIFGTGMATGKSSPRLLHAREPQKRMFLPPPKRLRQPGRPHQVSNMSGNPRNGRFWRKKVACGNWEDLTKLITCQNTLEIDVFAEKKVPAAAGETPPSFQDIGKSKDRFGVRKALAAAGKASP